MASCLSGKTRTHPLEVIHQTVLSDETWHTIAMACIKRQMCMGLVGVYNIYLLKLLKVKTIAGAVK